DADCMISEHVDGQLRISGKYECLHQVLATVCFFPAPTSFDDIQVVVTLKHKQSRVSHALHLRSQRRNEPPTWLIVGERLKMLEDTVFYFGNTIHIDDADALLQRGHKLRVEFSVDRGVIYLDRHA